jgi:hypothetical protein
MTLNRDYGSTEPMPDPYTLAQHTDIAVGLAAAKRADALQNCAECLRKAFAASIGGDETSAAGFRVDALAALHAYPSLHAEVVGTARPVIHNHADARALLQQARDLVQRVRNSTLPGTVRDGHLSVAMGAIDNDIDALGKGK